MVRARQDPGLHERSAPGRDDHSGGIDPQARKVLHEGTARRIIADDAERLAPDTESGEIRGGVPRLTRPNGIFTLFQNENGGFTRYARRSADKIMIRGEIPQDADPHSGHRIEPLKQLPRGRYG